LTSTETTRRGKKDSAEDVLSTPELDQRPSRIPNYLAEHAAFTDLAREFSSSSSQLAQRLCELARDLCEAGTAGISLLSAEDGHEVFRWIALAGVYESFVGVTTPRDFSPCGTCLNRGEPQLYSYPGRYFNYFNAVQPPIVEGLVVPFRASGRDLGTIWVVSHNETHRGFDREDVRVLQSLGDFAAIAFEQLQLREAAQQSEQRLRAILGAFGVPVYTTDASGRILHYNEAAVTLWGRSPEIGKDLWCGSWRIYSPDGSPLPLEECPMAVTLKENRQVRDVEIVIERPDGSRSAILPHPSPLRDASGKLIGAVNVLVDITERKRGEEAAARLAAIVESSDDAIIGKDLNGIITFWNQGAQRMFGFAANEVVGKSIRLLIPDDRQEEEDVVLGKLRRGERVDHYETVRRRKDGTSIDISLTVSPVKDSQGRIIGASKIARDISQRKEAEAAIKKASEVKEQFLGLISHELRGPISTILGNGMLLLKLADKLSDEDRRLALNDVVAGATKLEEDIELLLAFTRLEAAKVALEPLSLPAVVAKCLESFTERHSHRIFEVTCDPEVPPALGQETLISLVVQNLLANADKYSLPETKIEIAVSVNEMGHPEVHVKDRGIGLDEQDVQEMFTPFYRSIRARRRAGGMGLGLAVCKRALEAQGGTIRATARPDGGSDFSFSLMACDERTLD
jgi:PAS domain S-box-containing protein